MVDSTYRTELREFNELNFARFDAKVAQRFAESDAGHEKGLGEVGARFAKIDQRLDRIDQRLDQMDQRLDQIDQRFAQLDARFTQVDARFDQINGRFAQIDGRFGQVDGRFSELDAKMEKWLGDLRADLIKWMFIFWATSALSVRGILKL